MAQRVQLARTKGWRMPPGAVKVDRSTPYGNPFRESELVWIAVALGFTGDRAGRIAASVELFRRWWGLEPKAGPLLGSGVEVLALNIQVMMNGDTIAVPEKPDLAPLRGKDLACWCKLGSPCHAEVLLELANAEAAE